MNWRPAKRPGEMRWEVWAPTLSGYWLLSHHKTRLRARVARWWQDGTLPRDSRFRGAIVVERGQHVLDPPLHRGAA